MIKAIVRRRLPGILISMPICWVEEHQLGDGQTFRGNGKLNSEQEEIRKLKSQVKRLEMEKEILKKAMAKPSNAL